LSADDLKQSQKESEGKSLHCKLMYRRLNELRPHPSYTLHGLTVSASQLSSLAVIDDEVSEEPITITRDGMIIDGYARVERARMLRQATILCIEYDRTEEEALRDLLLRHLGSNRLNDYCRILLARELEPWFRKKAIANQIAGGEKKGSSNLTEAERIDVTARIAEAADVSVGNISKVKQLLKTAIPELLQALRRDEISINRAWMLSKQAPASQREELALPQCKRNIKRDMRALASRHGSKSLQILVDPRNLIKELSALASGKPGSFQVYVSNAQGRAVCLTKELLLELGAQDELLSTC
jgi:hypothetical protein